MGIRRFVRSRGFIAGVVGALLAGVVFTPAIANHSTQHNQNQINNNKQINQQQAQRLTAQRGTLQSLNQETHAFAETLDDPTGAGDADGDEVTLFTHGPLTFLARCFVDESGGGDDVLRIIVTSGADFRTTAHGEFTAGSEDVIGKLSVTTGTDVYVNFSDRVTVASEDGGTIFTAGIDFESQGLGMNVFGHDCLINGLGTRATTPA